MIGLAIALAAFVMPLNAVAHVGNGLSPNRVAVVNARTVGDASCWLSDSVSGVHLHRTTSTAGRATWRWRPAVWANGPDTVSIRCTKGLAHASTETFFLLGELAQISVIRNYALHLVYWAPSGDMPSAVAPAVSQLEADVKASLDAGATDNPFAIPLAYGDSLGGGDPRIASIDVSDDADPYPKPIEDYCAGVPQPCLGSPNVANEVSRVARQHGWLADNHSLVVFFTGPSVTVCYSRAPCGDSHEVCGYHALNGAGYAYAEIVMAAAAAHCGRVGPALFATQTLEHEQDEAVVDPWGYGLEVGDPCETDFAPVAINGSTYVLQSILDNGACAFRYTP